MCVYGLQASCVSIRAEYKQPRVTISEATRVRLVSKITIQVDLR
jgi:hypothetical protein